MQTIKYSPFQLGKSYSKFEMFSFPPGMRLIHPWKELLYIATDKNNYNARTYRSNELPSSLKRAVYTVNPSKHAEAGGYVIYMDLIPCVMLHDDCDWDEFKAKHLGDDVIALAEIEF